MSAVFGFRRKLQDGPVMCCIPVEFRPITVYQFISDQDVQGGPAASIFGSMTP